MTRLSILFSMALAGLSQGAGAQSADILLNCSACHIVGADKTARATGRAVYPDLNSQPARYLERQLMAFRTGLRRHPQMQQTAVTLGPGAGAMARLYADAPTPDLGMHAADADHDAAILLVEDGDWSRGLAPCASCHALDPQDRARLAPRLHGQPETYLGAQLRAYADGTRRSDTMGRMRAYSERLSADDIAALAAYYAAWQASQEASDD